MSEARGQCLCGAVSLRVAKVNTGVGACHCQMCRRWGGGPLLAADCGPAVEFEGEVQISVYDSSDWAERGFCSRCGSHLFYRLKDSGEYQIPVGLFDDQSVFRLDLQVYSDKKPAYYSFANATREMTEAQVIAAFAPDQAQ